jgi:hypothetical protein
MIVILLLKYFFAALLGGVGNRVRGGLDGKALSVGTQGGRLLGWAMPCGLIAFAGHMSPLHSGEIALAAFIGCTAPLFGSLSMGHGINPLWQDWLGMTAFSLLRVAPVGAVLWWFGYAWYWLIPVPVLGAALYWSSWKQPLSIWFLQIEPYGGAGGHPFQGPTWGEFTWGVLAGVCTLAACLH